jgi:hypothetical protein
VDRDVKITGTYSEQENGLSLKMTYDASLKKGWNMMFASVPITANPKNLNIKITTKDPGGLKWYFGDDIFDFGVKSAQQSSQPETAHTFSLNQLKRVAMFKKPDRQ